MTKLNTSQKTALKNCATTSARIRFLTAREWSRSEIAKELGIRYQHVRNVQITPVKQPKA